jgi:hypothetical protein
VINRQPRLYEPVALELVQDKEEMDTPFQRAEPPMK